MSNQQDDTKDAHHVSAKEGASELLAESETANESLHGNQHLQGGYPEEGSTAEGVATQTGINDTSSSAEAECE